MKNYLKHYQGRTLVRVDRSIESGKLVVITEKYEKAILIDHKKQKYDISKILSLRFFNNFPGSGTQV